MHLHKGKEFFDQDQLQKAREELEAAYHLRPHDEKVLNMLGMTYYKLEMLPQAEEMYVILAATNPDIYALQSNLGLIQLKLNKLEQARDSLNRALELQPSNSKAHFYMGLLYEKEEMWEDALYHFEQANAEKMVTKMQARLDADRNKPELVLPFQVIEVLQSDADTEPSLSSIVQEGIQSQASTTADGEITGRMRAQDLAQAMFQIENEEDQPSATHSEGSEMSAQIAAGIPFQPPFEEPQNTMDVPVEEEILGDEGVDSMAEKLKEEIQQKVQWEQAHSSIFPEPFGEHEPAIHADANRLIGPSVDEPFLLSEDIAADISTFLAQSRTEESPEEDVFFHETNLPELSIVRTPDQPGLQIPYTPEPDVFRIPTPEEVENEIGEGMTETPATMEAQDQEHLHVPEDAVEELSEEVHLKSVTSPAHVAEKVEKEEEELEVNFAVNENEEEGQTLQGFLQPSPLTPDVEEKVLEETQEIASPMETRAPSIAAPEPGLETGSTLQQINVQTTEETPVEIEPAAFVRDESSILSEPGSVVDEFVYPANLDQFSKDRLYIQPLIGSDRFLLIDPHLLEIIISDKLVCRIGTISSYTGNLQFTSWNKEKSEKVPLILVSGTGILFLADRRKEIFLISLNNEVIYVEWNHLLVAQSSLKIEPQIFHQQGTGASFSVSKVSGRGTLALTCLTKPLTVNVHEGLPANIPAQAVIAWSGRVVSEVMEDEELRKVMMGSEDESMFLRFRGTGDVVVEQGGLWGDRRTKRPGF